MADPFPPFAYGTAWKGSETTGLTYAALLAGFRFIDAANQPRHYDEAGVGRAVKRFLAENRAERGDLVLQTKFTWPKDQDQPPPYDIAAPIGQQVAQSFAASSANLGVQTIDVLLLHTPCARSGMAADDWAAWAAMSQLVEAGKVRHLGISNVTPDQLKALVDHGGVRPRFVQNLPLRRPGWDAETREICQTNGITYLKMPLKKQILFWMQ